MSALDPITAALRSQFGTSIGLPGLAPGLVVHDARGWQPATALTGPLLDTLLARAADRWHARAPAAAALTWKAYTYWLCLPTVAGLVTAGRGPALSAANVLVTLDRPGRLLTLGLHPDTPLSGAGALRRELLDEHVTPLVDAICRRARLRERALLGSLAANVAGTALLFGRDGGQQARSLLATLGLGGLVELVPAGAATRVRRKTCCLAFTLPHPKICNDCCLRP